MNKNKQANHETETIISEKTNRTRRKKADRGKSIGLNSVL